MWVHLYKIEPIKSKHNRRCQTASCRRFQNFQGSYKFFGNRGNWGICWETKSWSDRVPWNLTTAIDLEFCHHIVTTHHPFLVSNNWLLPREATASDPVSCSPLTSPIFSSLFLWVQRQDLTMTSSLFCYLQEELIRSSTQWWKLSDPEHRGRLT